MRAEVLLYQADGRRFFRLASKRYDLPLVVRFTGHKGRTSCFYVLPDVGPHFKSISMRRVIYLFYRG